MKTKNVRNQNITNFENTSLEASPVALKISISKISSSFFLDEYKWVLKVLWSKINEDFDKIE